VKGIGKGKIVPELNYGPLDKDVWGSESTVPCILNLDCGGWSD
jgi:hypothetical protein